jgi:hypothetical protein
MHPMCVDCGLNVSRLPRRWHDMMHESEDGAPVHLLVCLARCVSLSCNELVDYLLAHPALLIRSLCLMMSCCLGFGT